MRLGDSNNDNDNITNSPLIEHSVQYSDEDVSPFAVFLATALSQHLWIILLCFTQTVCSQGFGNN